MRTRRTDSAPKNPRTITVTLTFDTSDQRDRAMQTLTERGRTPPAYLKYLLQKDIESADVVHSGVTQLDMDALRRNVQMRLKK